MSRFNCKVVEAIPDRIVVCEENMVAMLFYKIRDKTVQQDIILDLVNKYLVEYSFYAYRHNTTTVFSNLQKK